MCAGGLAPPEGLEGTGGAGLAGESGFGWRRWLDEPGRQLQNGFGIPGNHMCDATCCG